MPEDVSEIDAWVEEWINAEVIKNKFANVNYRI